MHNGYHSEQLTKFKNKQTEKDQFQLLVLTIFSIMRHPPEFLPVSGPLTR